MKKIILLMLLPLWLNMACNQEPVPVFVTADIVDYSDGTTVVGDFYAYSINGIVTATVKLDHQGPGTIRAIHLHDGTCEAPGMHWNMGGTTSFCSIEDMNGPWGKPFAGDLGNVLIGEDGTGAFTLKTNLWSIGTGDSTDINGKIVIAHYNMSDFIMECDPMHIPDHTHTNPKLGCGMIK